MFQHWLTFAIISAVAGFISVWTGVYAKNLFNKSDSANSTDGVQHKQYDSGNNAEVKTNQYINNSPGALQAGRDINIIQADKEVLGRSPVGLYQKGQRIGTAVKPNISESTRTITMDEILFHQPLIQGTTVNLDALDGPYEFLQYKIRITHYEGLASQPNPRMIRISADILDISPDIRIRPED